MVVELSMAIKTQSASGFERARRILESEKSGLALLLGNGINRISDA
jgi:hypothetical protein